MLRFLNRFKVNSSRIYLERFCERAGKSLNHEDRILDAGCGEAPYRKYFEHAHYESADFCQVDKPYFHELTHVCTLDSIPVEDSRYDAVVMTQVLEHLPDPRAVLKELSRVLKPGCRLWITAPHFYPEHEQPYDFFRYTQFSLKLMSDEAGFEVEELEWLEGYFGTLAYQLEFAASQMPWKPHRRIGSLLASPFLLLLRYLFIVLSLWFSRIDLKYKVTTSGQCKNYALVLRKLNTGQSSVS